MAEEELEKTVVVSATVWAEIVAQSAQADPDKVTLSRADWLKLLIENEHYRQQVTDLQARGTKLTECWRALRDQVATFLASHKMHYGTMRDLAAFVEKMPKP